METKDIIERANDIEMPLNEEQALEVQQQIEWQRLATNRQDVSQHIIDGFISDVFNAEY